jgi:cytochrome c oxidase accessory protein FixG
MREQVCKYMCPYARFQSAMFDKDTLIISYDAERGEPRGSRGRKADPKKLGLGACIDCNLCVHVCPTGIDIRKGLQYECIGCAACIDVCNGVMDKMGYPRGLVRYDTQNGLAQHLSRSQKVARMFRPRVIVYTAILVLIVVGLLVSLGLRTTFKVNVVRDRASLARIVDEGRIENLYRLQIMNATEARHRFRVQVQGLPGIALGEPLDVELAPAEARWVTVGVQVAPQAAQQAGTGAHPIVFHIDRLASSGDAGNAASIEEKSTFVVPR